MAVANSKGNRSAIEQVIAKADAEGVNLLVLPELCITGYTCGDLFLFDLLIEKAEDTLNELRIFTEGKYPVVVLGTPIRLGGKLFNCAAVLHDGKILGIVPKTHLPNYGEYYELRQFSPASDAQGTTAVNIKGYDVPFGTDLIFECEGLKNFTFGVEICEDLWTVSPPCERLCAAGATIIANPSASDEVIGKAPYRRKLVSATSGRLVCGYVYTNAGPDESTQDMVFSAHAMVAENGTMLAENKPFESKGLLISEIDVDRLSYERHRITSYPCAGGMRRILFSMPMRNTVLSRTYAKHPFVPPQDDLLRERAEEILRIQSYGLKKRMEHTQAKTAVIGISGGLDSTLALLVALRAMDLMGRPHTDILAVSMPCFGTSERTRNNARSLCQLSGVSFREIPIDQAVKMHFSDIGQEADEYSITYENAQARERTQVLMDLTNKTGGIVIGTGDLSEMALGWSTYNGDHMSMYAVNCSVPKTLVRYIVRYEQENSPAELSSVLLDILDTPVSPELIPTDTNGDISQKTEDLIGPYELHDFFLYHMMRTGAAPRKIFRIAQQAFMGVYPGATILHWLEVFYRRFFSQQFKRSCQPDGPKVGTVALSPRGDWRMPSDASAALWIDEVGLIRGESDH